MATQTPAKPPAFEVYMKLKDPKMLARLMVIQEVSQRELAGAAGWKSHTYLGRMLKGQVSTCEKAPAINIARYLGVGVDDLFVAKVSSGTDRSGRAA